MPIVKTSQSQLWPILGSVLGFNDVFIIGIYHGYNKPEDSTDFLEDFTAEAKDIIENGFIYENNIYNCILKLVSADAPAKSFILNIKGHTGYSSCTKCTTYGSWDENRVYFSDISGEKRTDADYQTKNHDEFHLGSSILETIPKFGLVTNVPLDYLHLVCIGVMKKLLNLWLSDKLQVRLQYKKVEIISKN